MSKGIKPKNGRLNSFAHKDSKVFDDSRFDCNQKLAKPLLELIKCHPKLRFSQILDVYGFVQNEVIGEKQYWKNEFSLEPKRVISRVQSIIEKKSR